MFLKMKALSFAFFLSSLFCAGLAHAQEESTKGLLGVRVLEMQDGRGMYIDDFVANTPAHRLSRQGKISVGDVILKLAGRETNTLKQLQKARSLIGNGKQGKMVLRDEDGEIYHVWISRKNPAVAAAAPGGGADGFKYGAPGPGKANDDIRDGEGAAEPEGEGDDDSDGPDVR